MLKKVFKHCSQVEKPCKIIIIILILSPENRYMTHSSAGKLFDEGSNVDIMEGRGTVEPDGESSCASDLLRDEQHMDGFGSVSITKFRCFLNNELVKVFSDVETSMRLPLHPSCRARL